MNKEQRIERDLIITTTGLQWSGKNHFRVMPETDLDKICERLKSLGYTLGKMIGNTRNFELYFEKRWEEPVTYGGVCHLLHRQYAIFVAVPINPTNVERVFVWIDDHPEVQQGYSGSNEWKVDICNWGKIPPVGKLAYLHPPKGYWIGHELVDVHDEL
jgi:hypothetical protein